MASALRVLLAEDDRFLRRAGEAALRRAGFAVVTAVDDERTLELARSTRPDAILLDIIMPKLQGFEVLRRLKADPVTAPIPVIVLSNLGQESDVERALEGGAIGYLVKANVSLDELAAKVRSLLDSAPTT